MTKKQGQNAMSNQSKQALVWFGCGKPSHRVYSAECPAKQATCGVCQRVSHFKAFCRTKSSMALASGTSGGKHGASVLHECLRLPTRVGGNVWATNCHVRKLAEPIWGTIVLDHRNFRSKFTLKADVDSGSHCTVVTQSIFDSAFPGSVLQDLQCPILNFDGTEIDSIEGFFDTKAHFNGQQCPASIYVVDDSCEPVIGRNLLTRLGITIDFGSSFVH